MLASEIKGIRIQYMDRSIDLIRHDICRLGHDIYIGQPAFHFHGIPEDAFHEHLAVMGHEPDNSLHGLFASIAFQNVDCKLSLIHI